MVVDELGDAVYAYAELVVGIPGFKRVRRSGFAGHRSKLSNSNENDVGQNQRF